MKNFIVTLLFISISAPMWCQNINDNLAEISKSIIEQLTDQNKKTIAIVDFSSPNGEISELGRSFSNKLRINIAKNTRAIKIVNRSILQNALEEEQLLKDGIINPESAKKIKFIGVDVIILGEISDYGNNYSIEIQLIDTEQSDIIGGEILEIPKTESLRKLNEKVLINTKTNSNNPDSKNQTSNDTNTSNFYPIERELGDIKVLVENVKRNGDKILVQFKAYNGLNTSSSIGLYSGNNGLYQTKINNGGDLFSSSSIRIANKSCSTKCYMDEIITSKSWVKGTVEFENVPSLSSLELLQICFYYNKVGWIYKDLILRDIPIN